MLKNAVGSGHDEYMNILHLVLSQTIVCLQSVLYFKVLVKFTATYEIEIKVFIIIKDENEDYPPLELV